MDAKVTYFSGIWPVAYQVTTVTHRDHLSLVGQ